MYSNILTILQYLESTSMSQTKIMFFLLKSDPIPNLTNTANDTMIYLTVQDRNLDRNQSWHCRLLGPLSPHSNDLTSPLYSNPLTHSCLSTIPCFKLLSTIPHQNVALNSSTVCPYSFQPLPLYSPHCSHIDFSKCKPNHTSTITTSCYIPSPTSLKILH